MRPHKFAIVDVFADEPLTGNPLAVVTDADDLSVAQMAAIAAEFNLSETTFISAATLPGAQWRLRSFTPGGDEVSGAGHNALGAWWWLARSGKVNSPDASQELGGRVLPVLIDAPAHGPLTIGLEQGPVDLTVVDAVTHPAALDALGLRGEPTDGDIPLVRGSVGSTHLLVPLTTTAQVDAARPDSSRLRELLVAAGAQGCYIYSCNTDLDNRGSHPDAYARFFNPTVGISEDPATGSAAGPLAAHLVNTGDIVRREVSILQGSTMGRPSTMTITVDEGRTTLFGRCALSAEGQLFV